MTYRQVGLLALLILLSLISYVGLQQHVLLHWDDVTYVSQNPWVTNFTWESFISIFTEFRLGNWHPFTLLSYVPEYYFCSENAICYKYTNIILHGINGFLVYCLSITLLGRVVNDLDRSQVDIASIIAAVLFVIHPQHVESVIWIAERKDLLFTFFYLSGLLTYIRTGGESKFTYVLFVCSLMSKPMAMSFPVIILLSDLFVLKRITLGNKKDWFRLIFVEKLHFYVTALLVVFITVLAQKVDVIAQPSIQQKLSLVNVSIIHYVTSFFYPFNLSPFYPVELIQDKFNWFDYVLLGSILAVVLKSIQTSRGQLFWLFFLVTILPVIGLVKVGGQAFADRYNYLTMLGFYIVAGVTMSILYKKYYRSRLPQVLYTVLFVALMWQTNQYKDVWATDFNVWSYVAEKYPSHSTLIHNNLANSYFVEGQYKNAIVQYKKSLEINSQQVFTYSNLSKAYTSTGDLDKAREIIAQGIQNNLTTPWMYIEAGDAYFEFGDVDESVGCYQQALLIIPEYNYALSRLGGVFYQTGRYDMAIEFLRRSMNDSVFGFESRVLMIQAYMNIKEPGLALQQLDELALIVGEENTTVVRLRDLMGQL